MESFRPRLTGLLAALVVIAFALISTATASAEFGITDFDVTFANADGTPATQAGSHPYTMNTAFNIKYTGTSGNYTVEALKDADFQQILGLIGDTTAMPQCSTADFASGTEFGDSSSTRCGDDTAVGFVKVALISPFADGGGGYAQVYNLEPAAGVPAQLAFNAGGTRVTMDIGVKDGSGNNIVVSLKDTAQPLRFFGASLTVWGTPADPVHDPLRGKCFSTYNGSSLGNCPTSVPNRPFLTLPRACSGPLETSFVADSWLHPGAFVSGSVLTHDNASPSNQLGMTGCSKLGFSPTIDSTPSTKAANSPSGLDFSLNVADEGLRSPTGLAQSDIKGTVVSLPEGVAINPSVASGLAACSQADLAREKVNSAPGVGCPEASKIGSAVVESPLVDEPLSGSVFAARQGENPFGSLVAFYIVVKSPKLGIIVKQPVKVEPDPVTGQLTATADDIPQLPFAHFTLKFREGARAALATPGACGSYAANAVLTPWAGGAPITATSSFDISSGPNGSACPAANPAARPFTPAMSAGVTSPRAGSASPFVLSLTRPDGDQALKGLDVVLPAGLSAKLAGVPKCSEAALASIPTTVGSGQGQIDSPSCPAGSLLGSAAVSSGVGSSPFFVQTGKVYFAGPYKGAPFSLAVVTPAVAGPLDLGNVVVRAALVVDPTDAHVTVKTDPLPTILAGIPLQIREIRTAIDRPGFTLNPTSCAPKTISGVATSEAGASAGLASPFQVGECASLGLSPKLAISLTGKGQTTDDKHPGVHAVVSQSPGQSNLKKVAVTLPLSLALDPDNAQALCEFTDGSKIDPTCPKGSIVGKAVARTPILDQPLSGPVYFVKNIRKDPKSGREIRTLPKVVIPLTGENGLRLNLVGTSNVVNNHLVTTFDNIPDAPVSDFTLDIDGGKSGILVVSGTDICKSTQTATRQVDGQNGKTIDASFALATPACALKVLSKKVGKTSVAVKVGGLGAGKVTVTGKGIKKTSRTIASSTVATITAKRTHGKPGKVTVSFDPAGPAKVHKTTK